MSADFDPYQSWLGIEPHEQPADYYRLLGLPRFEADTGRIARAADERMARVRSYQMGPRGSFTQKLLNEFSAARVCLLAVKSKEQYDAALARHLRAPPQRQPVAAVAMAAAPPSVLTFGVSQPLVVPPPALPPAPPPDAPPLPRSEQAAGPRGTEPLWPEPRRPQAWWLPLAGLFAAAIVLLLAVGGWGLAHSRLISKPPPVVAPTIPAKPPAEPRKIVLMQESSGGVNFSPAVATLSGGVELRVIGTEEALANWATADDRAAWHFRLVQPGFFQAELTYATKAQPDEPAELELTVGERMKLCELRPTGGLAQFQTDTFTLVIPASGEHTLIVRPARHPAGEWLALKSVRFIPVGADESKLGTTTVAPQPAEPPPP